MIQKHLLLGLGVVTDPELPAHPAWCSGLTPPQSCGAGGSGWYNYPCQQGSACGCISLAASGRNLGSINFSYKNTKMLGLTCEQYYRA